MKDNDLFDQCGFITLSDIPTNLDNDPTNECITSVTNEKGEIIIVDACGTWTIPIENNVKATRSQVLALRNSSNLVSGCTYSISDYSRGCLAGDVEFITIDADAVNVLSMDANIKTSYDNVSWEGRYDIDVNRIVELRDNLGNIIQGRYGNEVDRFAFGRNNVYGNTVDNADVYMDCETTATINENTFTSKSFADLRGMAGIFEDNTMHSYGRLYLNGATTVDMRRNTYHSYSYNYYNGQDNILQRQNNFYSSSYVRKFDGNRWTVLNANIGRGDYRHYSGTAYNDQVTITSGGRLYQREGGTTDVRNTTISDLSYVDLQSTAGTTRIWRGNISALSYFYVRAAVTAGNRNYYSHVQSGSTYDYRSGTANVSMSNNDQSANGYIRWDNIAGTYNINSNIIQSRAEHRLTGTTGTHTHYYNTLMSYISTINLTNTVGSNMQMNTLSAYGRIVANGGNPRALYNQLNSIGILTLTNYTGTVQRSHIMSDARVNLTGTGNMYASTFGTSFVFNSTNLNQSYVTAFGNITFTSLISNNNRGNFHNLVNNLQ